MSNQGGNQSGGHQINLVQEYAEINRKYVETLQANAEINRKYVETLQANADLRVQNNQLFNDLKCANVDLLKSKQQLSPRGAIELLEERFSRVPPNLRTTLEKYQWLFNNDATFQRNVQQYCGRHMTAQVVGILATNLHNAASLDISNNNNGRSIVIFANKYYSDQLNLLCAICETLPIPYQMR